MKSKWGRRKSDVTQNGAQIFFIAYIDRPLLWGKFDEYKVGAAKTGSDPKWRPHFLHTPILMLVTSKRTDIPQKPLNVER